MMPSMIVCRPGPQARAELAGAAGEEPVVEFVEVVLVVEDFHDRAEPLARDRRHLRLVDEEVPGRGNAGERKVERQAHEGVQHHRPPAVEFLRHLLHGLAARDGAIEPAAVEHRLDRDEADEDRRDGEQHQG
jgi:hypothetical protein